MLRIIAIGRLPAAEPEARLVARYAARLRPALTVTELPAARGAPGEMKRREAAALLGALPANALAVALDQGGQVLASADLARRLESWLATGRPLCFLIGGAEGLDRAVIERADSVLSLGPATWPHFLVRAMLAEQLYRARAIALGHPYHREGRP